MEVLVIDDHPIVLEGCRQLLKFAGVKRIVQTESLAEGFRLYRSKKPDVIIVDLAMRTGALGGLSFIRRLRLHDTRTPILVFSMHNVPFIVSRALKIGANGYILKDTSGEEIVKAFEQFATEYPISVTSWLRRSPSWKRAAEPAIRCGPSPNASSRSCRCWPKASPPLRSPRTCMLATRRSPTPVANSSPNLEYTPCPS
jgi:DNA-binding NarL/FixJ family response regulator